MCLELARSQERVGPPCHAGQALEEREAGRRRLLTDSQCRASDCHVAARRPDCPRWDPRDYLPAVVGILPMGNLCRAVSSEPELVTAPPAPHHNQYQSRTKHRGLGQRQQATRNANAAQINCTYAAWVGSGVILATTFTCPRNTIKPWQG